MVEVGNTSQWNTVFIFKTTILSSLFPLHPQIIQSVTFLCRKGFPYEINTIYFSMEVHAVIIWMLFLNKGQAIEFT